MISGKEFPFIVMKLYEKHLKRPDRGNPTLNELEKLFDFLVGGLKFLHENGVIHRDLKPENIFTYEGGYVIGDFGIANYNPDIFNHKPETKDRERLGNHFFRPRTKPREPNSSPNNGYICPWSNLSVVRYRLNS